MVEYNNNGRTSFNAYESLLFHIKIWFINMCFLLVEFEGDS